MSAGGKCIAKMTVIFNETIPSEVVTCFCTRALLRYGAMLQCSAFDGCRYVSKNGAS